MLQCFEVESCSAELVWCPGNVRLSRPFLTFGCTEKTGSFYGQLIYRKFLFKFPAGAIKPEDSCSRRKPKAAPTWPVQSQLQGALGRSPKGCSAEEQPCVSFGGVLAAEMAPGAKSGISISFCIAFTLVFVLVHSWFTLLKRGLRSVCRWQ